MTKFDVDTRVFLACVGEKTLSREGVGRAVFAWVMGKVDDAAFVTTVATEFDQGTKGWASRLPEAAIDQFRRGAADGPEKQRGLHAQWLAAIESRRLPS